MQRRANGWFSSQAQHIDQALRCLGFTKNAAKGYYENREVPDRVYLLDQPSFALPTRMTGQPVRVVAWHHGLERGQPDEEFQFDDLGEMFCWWYDLVARMAGLRRPGRRANPPSRRRAARRAR